MNLHSLLAPFGLSDMNRPIRLRLWNGQKFVDDVLLVKQVTGVEGICSPLEYRLLCVAAQADLPLKQFIAMPAELQFVTSTGGLRSVCGIVDGVEEGESDGGLATYLLTMRDALTINEKGSNTRIFRSMSEVDITNVILGAWSRENAVLARAFNFETWRLKSDYPRREFTMQYKESDSAFLRRLWKRRGIAWFVQPTLGRGGHDAPAHTLVLFDNVQSLEQNVAGIVRYHRDDGTEKADSITAWHPVRTLTPGNVRRQSWDYKAASMMFVTHSSLSDQGELGNQLAAGLDDGLIDVQHAGDNSADYQALSALRMAHHEFKSKCVRGEGGGRDWNVAHWMRVTGHSGIDSHPVAEREFVFTELRVAAENNLPKALRERANRLFALNRWGTDGNTFADPGVGATEASAERDGRYTVHFTCVRRGVPILAAFDPRIDLPRTGNETVVVVGPETGSVHCDELGRVRVRFPGSRPEERAGAFNPTDELTEHDSAWVPVCTGWAGAQYGAISLPRVGTSAVIAFMGGDPDKPIIVSATHSGVSPPPSFSHVSSLPEDRHLSGIVSREIGGTRSNQLRIDDTKGQISAQLASDHASTQLNLGYLTHPRSKGRATPRGDGFELTSNDGGSIRTAKSLLISTWQRLDACANQLSAEEHLGLMQDCAELFKSLGQVALANQGLALDPAPQVELRDHIKAAPGGGNTDPEGIGGEPTLSVTAAAGMALTTPKTIVSYAGMNIDTVAQQNLQFSSGQCFNLNAGKGISLFSHHEGIRAIAHYGKFVMQSQHDDTEINSAKNIMITATDGIISLMAKEIRLIAEDGSFTKIGGGIVNGTNGDIKNQAANFPFSGPATMATELPTFGAGTVDQKFILKYGPNGDGRAIAPNRAFEIDMNDGSIVKGVSDAQGKTAVLQRDAMHIASVRIVPDEE
ncbi:MAG: type VI secretion system Vgr family protein [Pseudomonadota bacterium]